MDFHPQSDSARDLHFMTRALALAEATTAQASPNPQVGCVLVRQDKILAEGAHHYDHLDHAEIVALAQARTAGIDTTGATAYVTLEPCSHHGRTGPCTEALIAARISRCVIATLDPNPLVSGAGDAILRAAGVGTTVGVLEREAQTLNDPFAHFIQRHRPFVHLKAALSVDGKLAPAPHRRTPNQPHWLTGSAARADVQRLRHTADAVLTGIGTVLADDPSLTDRSALGPRRRPLLRVILDPQARIPLASTLVRSAAFVGLYPDLLLLHASTASHENLEALRHAGVTLASTPATPDGRLCLPAVLDLLGERGILSLLLECGSTLNGAFLAEDLVDKVTLHFSPTELGDDALSFAQGFPNPYLLQKRLQRTTQITLGLDESVTGYLHLPWPKNLNQ